jgi:hypothetical protein
MIKWDNWLDGRCWIVTSSFYDDPSGVVNMGVKHFRTTLGRVAFRRGLYLASQIIDEHTIKVQAFESEALATWKSC